MRRLFGIYQIFKYNNLYTHTIARRRKWRDNLWFKLVVKYDKLKRQKCIRLTGIHTYTHKYTLVYPINSQYCTYI